ncbi:M50 family metallopeptidase [Bacillus sp. 1NLA3E]|uniref:M50 family metallopeptidase n=1 Tax=Bacillus sp. 1NLA3E TaxID=666686 RepID=UPI000247E3F1|nr:M50 family metallopeptidase [Bacillus sp. 1NLA3E]AGK53200.1 hypothetical protein B1NLA3E_07190 [Bacillus sp. 1NLA3E]
MNIKMLILIYFVISLVGSRLPFVRVYLSHCHTLLNKMIRVCLEGHRTNKIKLYKDGTGVTTSPPHSFFKDTLLSYLGNTGALLASIGLYYLVAKGNYRLVVYLFIGTLLLSLLLWIRNIFGVIWAVSFVSLLIIPIFFSYEIAFVHISIFLTSVVFSHSILNAIQVFTRSVLNDDTLAKKSLFSKGKKLSLLVLGFILLGQSLYGGFYIFNNFLS